MAKDLCILCGKETPYDFETHVDFRVGYIEGAGQLCIECFNKGDRSEQNRHIIIPESLIKENPNNYVLGEMVRKFYYENYLGTKTTNGLPYYVCSICGNSTKDVDYDYLVGYDHLSCVLKTDEPRKTDDNFYID